MENFDVKAFDVKAYDDILSKGLSHGLGTRGQQVCIEAAICQVLGLPHSDDPKCVAASVRSFKIRLNDSSWSSPKVRAEGLHDLGLAQLGSLGVVSDSDFLTVLSTKIIRVVVPKLFREVFPDDKACLEAADRCEKEGTPDAADTASYAARYAADAARYAADTASYAARYAADAARYAADTASYAADAADAARYAADTASYAADTASAADVYLKPCADLAVETLRELNSPGVSLLEGSNGNS